MQLGELSSTASNDIFIAKLNVQTSNVEIVPKEKYELSIFPNPSSVSIRLQIFDNNIKEPVNSVRFYNIFGQLVKNLSIKELKETIDVSSFSNGLYFVEIDTDSRILTSKFIKN
jgi:hypothetical protein